MRHCMSLLPGVARLVVGHRGKVLQPCLRSAGFPTCSYAGNSEAATDTCTVATDALNLGLDDRTIICSLNMIAPVAESCTKADRPLDPPEKDIHASNACRCLSSAGMVQTALDIMRRDGNWTEMAALIECCKDLIPIEVLDVNLQCMLNAGAYSDLETALLPIPGVVAANEEKLLKLTPSFIDTIVRRILAMPTDGDGHGLRVASKLCAAYGLSPKEVAVRIRLLSYVTAGKWQLARMQSKSSALMLMTYEALINAKKYHAAERVHKYFGKKLLDREGKPVPPVTKAMLAIEEMNNFTEYLWFNLAPSNIIFVNSHITLQAFVKALAVARARPGGTFVGVDAEWSAFEKPLKNCSLLQLALHNEVYVFDMLALSPSPFSGKPAKDISLSEQGRAVLSALFHDPTIVKAGWAFNSSDLKVLRSSFQGFFGEAFNKPRGILDLQKLTKEYKADFGLQVQIESLSKCAEYFLGRKLNKFEQLSDWNYRPLKLSQLTYAALDSHVLLALLDAVMLTLGVSSPPTQTLVYYPPHVQQHPLGITVRQDLLATEGDQAVDSKNGRWEAADCWQSFIR